jgi:hypothetical protein
MWQLQGHRTTDTEIKFLNALKNTRKFWDNDKHFTKIVQKMEKGKNLKRDEFYKVQFYLQKGYQRCNTR